MSVVGPDTIVASARSAAAVTGVDPLAARRSIAASGALLAMSAATVLDAADVHAARLLTRLSLPGPGTDESVAESVALGAAFAVRAVRLGHVYVDLATVATTAAPDDEGAEVDLALLPWPEPAAWVAAVAASPLTAVGGGGPDDRPLRLDGTRLYLDRYWRHERAVAVDLLARSGDDPPGVDESALADGLVRLFPADGDDAQRSAAEVAVRRRFSVVAGGPGTGKTTTVARILALLNEQADALGLPPPRIALAAPTGKAAARLGEAVHDEASRLDVSPAVQSRLLATEASTLHRLLGWRRDNKSRFRHDGANQLPHTVVIVDETSMVSLSTMARLLEAVRTTARLVLVGDPSQLASVEAGAVLGDIVGPAAREAPAPLGGAVADGIVVLRRVHRYKGGIAAAAQAIEAGDANAVIDVLRDSGRTDVTWTETDAEFDPTTTAELQPVRAMVVAAARDVVDAARDGDGARALAGLRAAQVLCAHRRGPAGAGLWRQEIERWLRAAIPGYGGGPWFAGRPLLVTENDYGLGVFNGDTGVVVDAGDGRMRAVFDRKAGLLSVRPSRLASVETLYAMTIHKSQGSQFSTVVVVLPPASSPILTRELLYTAITRAQEQLVVVGPEESIRAAVDRPVARASGLADELWPAP